MPGRHDHRHAHAQLGDFADLFLFVGDFSQPLRKVEYPHGPPTSQGAKLPMGWLLAFLPTLVVRHRLDSPSGIAAGRAASSIFAAAAAPAAMPRTSQNADSNQDIPPPSASIKLHKSNGTIRTAEKLPLELDCHKLRKTGSRKKVKAASPTRPECTKMTKAKSLLCTAGEPKPKIG